MSLDTLTPLETLDRTLPLALGFWDDVAGTSRADGLSVQVMAAKPANARCTTAYANPSGYYLATDLPGLRRLEFSAGSDADYAFSSPPPQFRVEVSDPQNRYLPFAFLASPERGLLKLPCALSSPGRAQFEHGLPLFSSPTRQLSLPTAVIYAQLAEEGTGRAAAWALLAAEINGVEVGLGLADDSGRVAVLFPYPQPPHQAVTSPPTPAERFSWQVSVRAYYLPRPANTPAPSRPFLCDVLAQLDYPRRALDLQSPPQELAAQQLDYRRPLTLRSADPSVGGAVSSLLFIETA